MTDNVDIETLDHLAGSWRIHQLKGGHRFSADDVLTAWTAARARPGSRRLLDLGCGIGSVGLLTLWRMAPEATLIGVEAQEISASLARKTVIHNDLAHRVEIRLGDLRDAHVLAGEARFELITGSPPYFPASKATLSPHPQRAAARVELRGDVFDYCEAAARNLRPDGVFCLCHAGTDPRPEQAIARAGLTLRERRDVVARHGHPPLISLFVCGFGGERRDAEPFIIRDETGRWTDAYIDMRREMGTEVWNVR